MISYTEAKKLSNRLLQAGKTMAEAEAIITMLHGSIRKPSGVEQESIKLIDSVPPETVQKIIYFAVSEKKWSFAVKSWQFVGKWNRKTLERVPGAFGGNQYILTPTTEQCVSTWSAMDFKRRTDLYAEYAEANKFAPTREQLLLKSVGIPATR